MNQNDVMKEYEEFIKQHEEMKLKAQSFIMEIINKPINNYEDLVEILQLQRTEENSNSIDETLNKIKENIKSQEIVKQMFKDQLMFG